MNLKKRRRRRLIWLALALTLVATVAFVSHRLSPMIREIAATKVSNEASFAINRSIIRQIQESDVSYDRIVLLEKNVQGEVCAIKTNMAEINQLKTAVLSMVDEEVLELSVAEIGIPLGNLLFPAFFSGQGPILPVRVIAVSTSDATFLSNFSEAGINQTRHQIFLNVEVVMTVLTPSGTQNIPTQSQVLVAETVIVGTVPQSYMNIDTLKR